MATMRSLFFVMGLAGVAFLLQGCGSGGGSPTPAPPAANTISDVASKTASLSTLVKALKAAGLVDTLAGKGPYTVVAPTNDAFAALPKATLTYLLGNKTALTQVLTYHVASGKLESSALTNNQKIKTLEGEDVTVTLADGKVMINKATVTTPDVGASNGVVHIIDKVLIPPGYAPPAPPAANTISDVASKTASLSTLVTALKAAGLVDTLAGKGPYTVVAPTNDAFAALPKATLAYLLGNKTALTQVLTYHVASGKLESSALTNNEKIKTLEGQDVTVTLAGDKVMINKATVTTADVGASNGVVHIIDEVLIPPGFAPPTIPDIAIATADLSTLVAALKAGKLVTTLSGGGPFTVFAPTNEAFKALPDGVLDALLKPANIADLQKVLKYHVVSGDYESSVLTNGQMVTTLEGETVKVTLSGKSVKINTATVTIPDVLAGNGVVHVIDGVLLPPNFVPPTSMSAIKSTTEIQI